MSDTQTLIENRPPSVASLFLERVAATPDAEAYRYPVLAAAYQGPDTWKSLTWAQAAERVHAIAAGLIELGVQPEQRVALAASTRLEWILVDLGIMCARRRHDHGLPADQRRRVGLHPLRLREPGADRGGRGAARQGGREEGRAAAPHARRRHRPGRLSRPATGSSPSPSWRPVARPARRRTPT